MTYKVFKHYNAPVSNAGNPQCALKGLKAITVNIKKIYSTKHLKQLMVYTNKQIYKSLNILVTKGDQYAAKAIKKCFQR